MKEVVKKIAELESVQQSDNKNSLGLGDRPDLAVKTLNRIGRIDQLADACRNSAYALKMYSIVSFSANTMSDSTSGVIHISLISGNDMTMKMKNRLSRCFSAVHPNIIAIWCKVF